MTDSSTKNFNRRSLGARLGFIAALAPASWLSFLWSHEFGHVLGAWFTGGEVQRVFLHPLVFSRTDVSPNPSPFLVAWAGAGFGPLIAAFALSTLLLVPRVGFALYRSVLGFSFIANGSYIGLGVIQPVGDTNDILDLGGPRWTLGFYGILALGIGFVLWGGLRPDKLCRFNGHLTDWIPVAVLIGLTLILAAAGSIWFPP